MRHVLLAVFAALSSSPVWAEPSKTIVINVSEELASPSGSAPSTAFREAFKSTLIRAGWEVVDASATPKAPYVVTGHVFGSRLSAAEGAPAAISCTLSVVTNDSRREIVGMFSSSVKPQESYPVAANVLASEAGSKLVVQLLMREQQTKQSGHSLQLTAAGLKDFEAVQNFKRSLEALAGVEQVGRGNLRPGTVRFDVLFKGSAEQLAALISKAKWKEGKVTARAIDAGSVDVKFR